MGRVCHGPRFLYAVLSSYPYSGVVIISRTRFFFKADDCLTICCVPATWLPPMMVSRIP